MGQKGSSPSQPAVEQKTEQTPAFPPKDDTRFYDQLKEKYLETKEIEEILQSVKQQYNVNNPLIVCVTTKKDNKVFEDEKSEREYIRIIKRTTHREVKKQITDILNTDLLCDEPKYDGLIILLICVCFVALVPQENSDKKKIDLKFFYDEAEEGRHIEKLKKDIIYRLDDMFIQGRFTKSVGFYDDPKEPNDIGIVDLSEKEEKEEKKEKEKEEKEEKKDDDKAVGSVLRPSGQMEQSDPNGTIVLWSKPPTIKEPKFDDDESDDPQKDSANKPQTNTDIQEEEAD